MRRASPGGALLLATAAILSLACERGDERRLEGDGKALPPGVSLALRGHPEAEIGAGGELVPLYLSPRQPIEVCLVAPRELDTTSWQAKLWFAEGGEGGGAFAPPSLRAGTTLCFRAPATEIGSHRLCGEVESRLLGHRFRLPCRPLVVAERPAYRALSAARSELAGALLGGGFEARLAEADRLRDRAAGEGFPFLAAEVELVVAYAARQAGSASALAEARRRLSSLPAWLDQPTASWIAAAAALEQAKLDLTSGGSQSAWQNLRRAGELFKRLAEPEGFTAAIAQSVLLAELGAQTEAVALLRAELSDCERYPCAPNHLPSLQGELGWLLLLEPDAGPEALAEARQLLERALASPAWDAGPLERANSRISLAYADLRQGRDPRPELEAAERLLAGEASPSATQRFLRAWIELVSGLDALGRGDTAAALAACAPLAAEKETPRLAVWGLSCVGAAERRQGDLAAARESYAQALLAYELASPAELRQNLTLGPSQRADDYYQAARVEVELGRPQEAWRLLAELDRLAAREREHQCRAQAEETALAGEWRAADERRAELLGELLALEAPTSRARRQQLEPVLRDLKREAQELAREVPRCSGEADASRADWAGFRAVPLPEEVLLLERRPDGTVLVARRAPLDRRSLRDLLEEVSAELDQRRLDDEQWGRLLAPLARALAPPAPERLRAETAFALHGVLQDAPVAALPVTVPHGGSPRRWLADWTTVVQVPAEGERAAATAAGEASWFLVDPDGNLAGARSMVETYRRLFPGAHVLAGPEATVAALSAALTGSGPGSPRRLHLDAHGLYDPAFPELASLELADGRLTASELARLPAPRELVNLSACKTGRSPTSADSGLYGLAGTFAQRGTAWVVASRGNLDDGVAKEFNQAFYASLAAGHGVVESYAVALAGLRGRWPPAAWAGLVLVSGRPPPGVTREKGAVPTPRLARGYGREKVRKGDEG